MLTFKVETRNPATGGWEAVASIRPDYAAQTAWVGWLRRRRYIVIGNADSAELAGELKAVALAKRLRGDRRIERTSEIDGAKVKTVVWENGRWQQPIGWIKRLKAWSV